MSDTMTINTPVLNDAELLDFACRVHDAVCTFKALRASSVWGVTTFRVGDVVDELTTRQSWWLKGLIGDFMGTGNVELIRMFEIDLPEDLQAGKGEAYGLQMSIDKVEVAGVDVDIRCLRFGAAPIP